MRAAALAILLCAGCNQIFGLGTIVERDAPGPDVNPCALHGGDPGFHDEDGDGLDDRCDNCPGVPNPDQSDMLEAANGQMPDGVGDACDPAPGTGGDQLVRFISFDEPAADALIQPVSGAWHVTGGALYVEGGGAFATLDALLVPAPPAGPYAMETHGHVDMMNTTVGNEHELGLVGNYVGTASVPADGSGTCEINRGWSGSTPKDTTQAFITNQGTDQTPLGNSQFAMGASYRMRVVVHPTQLDCRFIGDGGDSGANSQQTLAGMPLPPGKVGFEVLDVSAHYDYIAVYALGS